MSNTAKSFSIVTSFSLATRLLSFVFKMWMSRTLGAEAIGLYQMALSVIMMLLTLTAGAPMVLSRKIAETHGDVKKQNSLLCASIMIGLAISIPLFLLLFFLRNKIDFLFSNANSIPIFIILLPTLITSTLYASLRSWFWGKRRFLAFSSTELLDEAVKFLLAILLAGGVISTTIDGAKGVAIAMTLADIVCVLVLAILFFIAGGRFAKPCGFKDLTLRTIPLSATRITTSLGAYLTSFIIPKMLVKNGLDIAQATAEYGRASGMALPLIMAPIMFVGALSVVLVPDIAQLRAQGQIDKLRTKLSSAITFTTLIASVFFVLYLPLGKIVGILLFKDEGAGTFISYCSVILYPIALANATTPMLNSLGKEKNTLLHTLIGALTMLPCIFLLPKFIGVYSMAVASGLCFVVIAVLNFCVLKKEIGSFANYKKVLCLMLFSLPLALTGMFSARLLSAYAGNIATLLTVGVLSMFFEYIFISAFDIADLIGYVKMLKPNHAHSFSKHQRNRRNQSSHHHRRAKNKNHILKTAQKLAR